MAFGLFAAVVYMKTSNLIFAIVVHAMNDFMAIMASSGSLSSQQTNPLTILYEWFIFGTLAFALFYTGWTQREQFSLPPFKNVVHNLRPVSYLLLLKVQLSVEFLP